MFKRLTSLIGDSNEREIRKLQPVVDKINSLEPDLQRLNDDELRARTAEFRERFNSGEDLDDLLPEAFAAVREAAKRCIGQRHYDVQLVGGMILHEGKIAEMKTGEGKTLVATLAVFLNALPGNGVHVITVNDYLAKRDTQWMGAIYNALGLSVGCIQHESAFLFDHTYEPEDARFRHLRPAARRQAYQADITYGTNNEFGFDYLRDNMVVDLSQCVQRELNYAIVDEVDNILIDEARTPLIISGAAEESTKLYITFAKLVPRLRPEEDYKIEERTRDVSLTEIGVSKVEKALGVTNLYDPANYSLTHYLDNALKASVLYKKDRDYVVKDGEVIIVDEFTGRLMFGRRYSEGLHQAIEAKEGVKIQRESITMATITFQNYFRMYGKLAGMTGTAATEAEEFHKIYKLDVVAVPTNKPNIRKDHQDQVYKTEEGKFGAVVKEIEQLYRQERPVLVGTVSIEKSERLSQMITRKGIQHQVLNAKNHEKEAGIIAQAGRPGAVTIATNMAGRGVDIILGGEPPNYQVWQDVEDYLQAQIIRFIHEGMNLLKQHDTPADIKGNFDEEFGILRKNAAAVQHELQTLYVRAVGESEVEKPSEIKNTIRDNEQALKALLEKLDSLILLKTRKVEDELRRIAPKVENPSIVQQIKAVIQSLTGEEKANSRRKAVSEILVKYKEQLDNWVSARKQVVGLGGLHIVGTERHEARRIDNQLRGRAGRQGDPGSSRFYVSLEDDVMRRFGGDRVKGLMDWAGFDENTPLESGLVSKLIENAQTKVEAYHFDIRKHLVDYDDVINKQREVIYSERRKLLSGADLKANVQDMIRGAIKGMVDAHLGIKDSQEQDFEGLFVAVNAMVPLPAELGKDALSQMSKDEVEEALLDFAMSAYDKREEELGAGNMRILERLVMLRAIDSRWIEHLTAMENMRQGIGLQSLAQRDPLVAYKTQGHQMFADMEAGVQNDIVHTIYRAGIVKEEKPRPREPIAVGAVKTIGRNDPCPCGSGKKYKKCHGKET